MLSTLSPPSMARKSSAAKKLAGLALLGAITYLLANPRRRDRVRRELANLAGAARAKGKAVGSASRKTWGASVDAATRVYRQSRSLTKQQLRELADVADEIKSEWTKAGKKPRRK